MRHPQLLIHEGDGRLEALLAPLATARKWALHTVRDLADCTARLADGPPAVVVVKFGRDLERELTLLERIAWLFPEVAVVAVGEPDQGPLAGLAWDLGARYVLFPPQPRELLPEVVAAFLDPGAAAP